MLGIKFEKHFCVFAVPGNFETDSCKMYLEDIKNIGFKLMFLFFLKQTFSTIKNYFNVLWIEKCKATKYKISL